MASCERTFSSTCLATRQPIKSGLLPPQIKLALVHFCPSKSSQKVQSNTFLHSVSAL